MPIITALGRLKQEDREFKATLDYMADFKSRLGYIVRPCLKKKF
jgi:hypothetical protein